MLSAIEWVYVAVWAAVVIGVLVAIVLGDSTDYVGKTKPDYKKPRF